jgi:hypothetical protein
VRLVIANGSAREVCSCRPWALLNRVSRDFLLWDFMQRASLLQMVQLKLLVRGDHVGICELLALKPGQGRARRVMTELCQWADCARATLELTPSSRWGSDVEQLTEFYESLGFEANREPPELYRPQGRMIRYPVRGRGHVRL